MKRCVAYVRVSTNSQDTDSQLLAIKTSIEKSGDVLVNVYRDHGISGSKGRSERPALNQLLTDASEKKFDMVTAFSLDRLGRSLPDLLATMQLLQVAQVDLRLLQNDLDTSTSSGRLMFSIFGAIAEFERSLISERVKAGLEKAKKTGKKLGRPSKINQSLVNAVTLLHTKSVTVRDISKTCSVGVGTVYRILRGEFSPEKLAA